MVLDDILERLPDPFDLHEVGKGHPSLIICTNFGKSLKTQIHYKINRKERSQSYKIRQDGKEYGRVVTKFVGMVKSKKKAC